MYLTHMRKMFQHFPEILLIDATHDTNDCNYNLGYWEKDSTCR
jgi:hypothetical protein